jgi:hypothetical protein
MSSTPEKVEDEFRVDIGRAGKGRTFIRVVHIPSGKERVRVGLCGDDSHGVTALLISELRRELGL